MVQRKIYGEEIHWWIQYVKPQNVSMIVSWQKVYLWFSQFIKFEGKLA